MKKLRIFLVFLISFMCILTCAAPAFAFSGTSTGETVTTLASPATTDEMQQKENIANDKYNLLLNEWAKTPGRYDDVDANFPEFFGGAYINNDKELVIQVTALSDEIVDYFENLIDLKDTVFQVVTYSIYDLMAAHQEIVTQMFEKTTDYASSISGVGISYPDNAVTLYIVSKEKSADYKATAKEALTTFENVIVIETSGKDESCAAVGPGTEINGDRSVGFWATDSSGNLGIVTAPHASMKQGQSVTVSNTSFGTAGKPVFSGSTDAIFVKRTNTNFTPTRNVSGWDFNLASGGYTSLSVGSTAYSKGKSSGCQRGVIQDTNYTTNYNGVTLTNTVLTAIACELGDSGGIVAGGGSSSQRYMAGIVTGRTKDNFYLIYVKASGILSSLSVSIY